MAITTDPLHAHVRQRGMSLITDMSQCWYDRHPLDYVWGFAALRWAEWLDRFVEGVLSEAALRVVMLYWSPWIGRAPPAVPLMVQCIVQRK